MKIEHDNANEGVARDIVRAARGIRYGYIQVIIQDSKIVQIDKTEKIRLDERSNKSGGGI